jgi:predicted nucleotidyltransferase
MTPDAFTDGLKEALGDRLTMVALFGSAAVGDTAERFSDVNIMVVCAQLGVEELDAIARLSKDWSKTGNPPPLMFAHERLMNSSHVFPIELLDIKENHRVLYGRDVLMDLPISQEHLRFQLEHELKGKLIQLREGYMLAVEDGEALVDLMLRTLSNFQIMLKAALRFYSVNVPARKREAVSELSLHVPYDLSVFEELQGIKDGTGLSPFSRDAAKELFMRYLEAIERSADLIAALGQRD